MAFNSEYLPIEINNTSYHVDPTQYRRTTVPVARQQRDNSREPGENTLDTTGSWVRSQTDWSHGAGQLYLDNVDSDRLRFFSSIGIDIWTKGQITLLNKADATGFTQTFNTSKMIIKRFVKESTGVNYIYIANGADVTFSASPNGSAPTWTPLGALNGVVTDITSDGTNVYFAQGPLVLQKQTLGSAISPSNFGSLTPDLIQVAAGRLIGADAANIFELNSSGAKATSSLDYTMPLGNPWIDITSGTNGIFAAVNSDNTGVIYFIGASTTDGTLNTPVITGSLPRNESINAILGYGNLICIATSLGFRLALIDQQSSGLSIGPVIDTAGEAFSLELDGQYVWWGTNNGHTYRADLAVFTSTLVPAYASDIQSHTNATSTDKVNSIARIDNKLFIGIDTSGASVANRETYNAEKVATGTLVVGEITWSTVIPKLLRSGVIDLDRSQYENSTVHYNAAATGYVNSTDTYTHGAPTSIAVGSISMTANNQNNSPAVLPNLLTGRPQAFVFADTINTSITFDLTLTLTRGASPTTKAPILHDWQCVAVAVPRRIDEIIVPIVLREEVLTSRNSGAPQRFNSKTQFSDLRTLMENGQEVTYKEGTLSEQVTIERLEMAAERLSDDGSWWEGTLMVRLLTVPPI